MVKAVQEYSNMLTELERQAWDIPDDISVSEWASKHRVLEDKGNAEPGPWDNRRTPFLVEIMDAFKDPLVEQVTFKKPAQIGGTEVGLNLIGYTIQYDPGPTLIVLPNLEDAKKFSRKRVFPLITETPALQHLLPSNSDDLSRLFYGLLNMDLRLAGAESPAALASDPIRIVIFDEVNKYPRFSGKEADPISLGKKRQNTFRYDKKRFVASTPTIPGGNIDKEYENSDKRRYFVPCPHCENYQTLQWKQVKFNKDEDPEIIKYEQTAYYECEKCQEKIFDSDKEGMLSKGVWCPQGMKVTKQGTLEGKKPINSNRGYWINAIYSPWFTFSDLAAEFLTAKGDRSKLMDFVNSFLAEEWKPTVRETSEDSIKHLIQPYPENYCPEGVEILLGGVDVQADHFWVDIWGWGLNERNWLITQRRLESWKEVAKVLFETEYKAHGERKLTLSAAAIDSGHRTSEVYKFCTKYRGLAYPVKGQEDMKGMKYKYSNIDKLPDGKPLPGGIMLWSVNKYFYNDKLERFLSADEGDDGRTHFYSTVTKKYLRQLCSEELVEDVDSRGRLKLVWRTKKGYDANHFRDTRNYGLALADILKIWTLTEADLARKPKVSDQSSKDSFLDDGNFLDVSEEWL